MIDRRWDWRYTTENSDPDIPARASFPGGSLRPIVQTSYTKNVSHIERGLHDTT